MSSVVERRVKRGSPTAAVAWQPSDHDRMEEPPAEFVCPITMLPMLEPVVTADGQTYERHAIQGWLLTHNTSPATGAVLPHKELAPNFALRKAIERGRRRRR